MFYDIYYNTPMREFWMDAVDMGEHDPERLQVIDATDIGHATGTGIIIFK